MAWKVPPSFVQNGPKIRVLIIVKWEWPETAKNRGEPQKMKFWGGRNGRVVAPGVLVIYSVDKKSRSPYKKFTFGTNIQIFWSKLHIFIPSSQLEPHRSMGQCFRHGKGVSLVPSYEGTKSFTPSPPKNGFLTFLAKYRYFFGSFDQMPDQKTVRTSCLGGFSVMMVPNFCLLP